MKLLLLLLSGFFLTGSHPKFPEEYYVEVPYSSSEDLKSFQDEGFDVGGINLETKTASLIVKRKDLARASRMQILSQRPVLIPDDGYKKPADIERILVATETAYPNLAKTEKIGKSVEGRDIWAIELTSQVSKGLKKTVLFDAMHHAREVMTPEVALDIVEYLTKNYETDAKVRGWLDQYKIWVVPMVNPDGNNKVWNSNPMWRKNTRGGYGVDVNRNYPYEWNSCDGSSGNQNADDYRGPSAGSEPENKTVTELVSRIRPMFNISYHSYSELVIYPFGCNPKQIPSPDKEVYHAVAKELAGKLVRDSGQGTYRSGTPYELLYDVDGGSVDWMYAMERVMSFVIEVNSTSQGFQPSYKAWRDKTVLGQRAGWMYILDRMAGAPLPKLH